MNLLQYLSSLTFGQSNIFFQFMAIAIMAFVVSSFLVPMLIYIAKRVGALDKPNQRKVHSEPKPLLGGIAIFGGYTAIFALMFYHMRRIGMPVEQEAQLLGMYISSAFLLIVGLVDDLKGMTATTKLICQIAAATLVIFLGVRIRFWINTDWLQSLLTLGWFIIITNAFNLLDNMDGLSGGVAAITTFLYFLLCMYMSEWMFAYLLLGLTFAIVGFLRYNFYPSRIFMGDTGSLFIGFNIACFSAMITYLGYGPAQHLPIVTPMIILAVPLYDTASVVWIRIREGRSIFTADKNHFSHRLVALGMTQRQAVFVILLLTFAVGLMAVLLPKLSGAQGILVLIHTAIIFLVIALLERSGAIKMRELGESDDGESKRPAKPDVDPTSPK